MTTVEGTVPVYTPPAPKPPKVSSTGHPRMPQSGLAKLEPWLARVRLPGMTLKTENRWDVNRRNKVTVDFEEPRTLADANNQEIIRVAEQLGILGLSPENGRQKNAELYANALMAIGEKAALEAIEKLLAKAQRK